MNMTTQDLLQAIVCPDWCDGEHVVEDDGTISPSHGLDLLPGEDYTSTHGPLMFVALQGGTAGTELWVDLPCNTLTAEMADRLAGALKRGAEILRASDDARPDVQLCPYPDPVRRGAWVRAIRHTPSVSDDTA